MSCLQVQAAPECDPIRHSMEPWGLPARKRLSEGFEEPRPLKRCMTMQYTSPEFSSNPGSRSCLPKVESHSSQDFYNLGPETQAGRSGSILGSSYQLDEGLPDKKWTSGAPAGIQNYYALDSGVTSNTWANQHDPFPKDQYQCFPPQGTTILPPTSDGTVPHHISPTEAPYGWPPSLDGIFLEELPYFPREDEQPQDLEIENLASYAADLIAGIPRVTLGLAAPSPNPEYFATHLANGAVYNQPLTESPLLPTQQPQQNVNYVYQYGTMFVDTPGLSHKDMQLPVPMVDFGLPQYAVTFVGGHSEPWPTTPHAGVVLNKTEPPSAEQARYWREDYIISDQQSPELADPDTKILPFHTPHGSQDPNHFNSDVPLKQESSPLARRPKTKTEMPDPEPTTTSSPGMDVHIDHLPNGQVDGTGKEVMRKTPVQKRRRAGIKQLPADVSFKLATACCKIQDPSHKSYLGPPNQVTLTPVSEPVVAAAAAATTTTAAAAAAATTTTTTTTTQGQKSRKPLAEDARIETSRTRDVGACIRCKIQRVRCKPTSEQSDGPCTRCAQVALNRSKKVLHHIGCYRYKLQEVLLFRTRELRYTTRWQGAQIREVATFGNTIRVSIYQGLASPLEIRVRRYKFTNTDMRKIVVRVWADESQARRPQFDFPYALASVNDAKNVYRRYIADHKFEAYEKVLSDPDLGKEDYEIIIRDIYRMAKEQHYDHLPDGSKFDFYRSPERWDPKQISEQSFMAGIFDMWFAMRQSTGSSYIEEGADRLAPADGDTIPQPGWTALTNLSTPKMIVGQFNSINITCVLRPMAKVLLKVLMTWISDRHYDRWMSIFYGIFIMLREIAYTTKDAYEHGSRNPAHNPLDPPRPNWAENIADLHESANILLAYWHYFNCSTDPNKIKITDEKAKSKTPLRKMTHEELQVAQGIWTKMKEWKTSCLESTSDGKAKWGLYKDRWPSWCHPLYFASQMFEDAWDARPVFAG